MKKILFTLILAIACVASQAQITYTRQDSLNVVNLLKKGREAIMKNPKENLMLFYGHKLQGIPYVAHTLEVNKHEQLVVNMRQMDCTTFVETVLALSMTTKESLPSHNGNQNASHNIQTSSDWQLFVRNLMTIRYRNGKVEGYESRNHYFLWWAENNEAKGIVSLPLQQMKGNALLAKQRIHIDYMTTHSSSYSMLKGNTKAVNTIRNYERQSEGKVMMYIPQKNLGLNKSRLSFVKDGDILAICTRKQGLDTTHIGIAEWGSDGRLHLLNASQVHKKVILEPMTLKTYMSKHPTQLGTWVLTVNN